jgi:predicted ester cyclase
MTKFQTTSCAQQKIVERFYYEGLNRKDEDVMLDILHPNVKFRSALGAKKTGSDAVIGHMNYMHSVLGRHVRQIEDLVVSEEDDDGCCKIAARIKCSGVHRADFFGVAGTGTEVRWCNAAWFTIQNGLITEWWVLGDVDSLKRQLGAETEASCFE